MDLFPLISFSFFAPYSGSSFFSFFLQQPQRKQMITTTMMMTTAIIRMMAQNGKSLGSSSYFTLVGATYFFLQVPSEFVPN